MDEEDLIKIRRDLLAGNIDRLIRMRLDTQTHERISDKICPVCGGEITNESFVLEFGASYLRRKARFDGVDCLEYFVSTKLKNNHESSHNDDAPVNLD
jgi:hypothetical protein